MSDERWLSKDERRSIEQLGHPLTTQIEIELLDHAEAADELIAELAAALRELRAMVWGECPWLLSELTGGNANVDMQIIDVLARVDALAKENE